MSPHPTPCHLRRPERDGGLGSVSCADSGKKSNEGEAPQKAVQLRRWGAEILRRPTEDPVTRESSPPDEPADSAHRPLGCARTRSSTCKDSQRAGTPEIPLGGEFSEAENSFIPAPGRYGAARHLPFASSGEGRY